MEKNHTLSEEFELDIEKNCLLFYFFLHEHLALANFRVKTFIRQTLNS